MEKMEKKKGNLGSAAAGAGKAAAELFSKAKKTVVSAIDQNDDGEFNMKDVAAIAGSISATAKRAAAAVKDSADARAYDQELKTLSPIFEDDLDSTDFLMPKLVRITEMDKRHAESELCKGSIGHMSAQKELRIINIYRDKTDIFGLSFYPDMDSEVYYVDPIDRNRYIALDDYFGYLKVARVNELQKIAQDLGATHFKVIYNEHRSSNTEKTGIGTVRSKINVDINRETSTNSSTSVEIAAEMTCPGHAPIKPHLVYLQREPSIQSLIALRMDEQSPISHQKYTLQLSNSSGIKEMDAVKIDAALKAIKCNAHATVTLEAQKEANRFFEYEIDF